MDNQNKNIDDFNPDIENTDTKIYPDDPKIEDIDFSDNTLDNILESDGNSDFVTNDPTLDIELDISEQLLRPKKSNKRILQGIVVSSKPDKTIVVKIVRQVAHPLYKKYYKRSKKIMAHDELNECNVGDTVRVIESRPISKMKRWSLIEIIERAK